MAKVQILNLSSDWSQTMACYLFTKQPLLSPRGDPDWWQHNCTIGTLRLLARQLAKIPSGPSRVCSVQLEDTERELNAAMTLPGSENPCTCLIYQPLAGQLDKSTHPSLQQGPHPPIRQTHQSDDQNSTKSSQQLIVQKQCNCVNKTPLNISKILPYMCKYICFTYKENIKPSMKHTNPDFQMDLKHSD